ncbi:MAG: hypothetical protein GWM92_02510 [Gemmatimonadetes bacterium]|nr:hypothetical protein [Gemmatimonadota bacterium]NIR77358.1 hypothetical protein [Gemmatimonadota bacterium]NIT85884.1 hypothetical protein [Gemmatimonadota bacterium]NIU29706.1 hypothetical protein [Gemmatimonadota bacterium]NIU34737.1 hypothetical protein [Gemmatimonadota bacterium]
MKRGFSFGAGCGPWGLWWRAGPGGPFAGSGFVGPWGAPRREHRIRWLERYREDLEAEIERVDAELERLREEGGD